MQETRRVSDGDAACDCAFGRVRGPRFTFEGSNYGHYGIGLNGVEFGEGVDASSAFEFVEADPRAQKQGAVAYGHYYVVGERVGEVGG